MAGSEDNSASKGFLRKAFKTVAGVFKELTIHTFIHFTIAGGLIAMGYAGLLTPILDPIGAAILTGLDAVGLGEIFNTSALDALKAGSEIVPEAGDVVAPPIASDDALPVFGQ